MTNPASEPPQAARKHAGVLVVRHDLHILRDTESSEGFAEHERVGQRMASVRPGSGTGEVVAQMRVDGAGNMLNRVFTFAPRLVVELVAAVDDHNSRIVQMGG